MVTKVLACRAYEAENRRDGDVYFVRAKMARLTRGSRTIWYLHPEDSFVQRLAGYPDDGDYLICMDGVLQVGARRNGRGVDGLYSYFRKAFLPVQHEALLAEAQVWFQAHQDDPLPVTVWLSAAFPAYSINTGKRRLFLTRATPRQLQGERLHFASEPRQSPITMKVGDLLLTESGRLLAVRSESVIGPDGYERGTLRFPKAALLR